MQNTLDGLQHAKLTFILCIRNTFEPVKYRAKLYYVCAISGRTHRHTHIYIHILKREEVYVRALRK